MLAALRSGDTVATARLSHLSYWYPGSAHAALDDVSLVLEGMTLVAWAGVLAMRLRLVVLDEPTSLLDPEGASLVLTSASRLRKAGRTLVISEHRLEQLVRSADRVVSVEKGRVQAHAPSDWRTAVVAVNVPRTSAPGPEAWSLNGVTAGFSGQAVLEGVTL